MEPPSDGTDALEPIEMLQDTSFNSYSPSRPVRRWHWRCVVELCCLGRCCVQDVSGAALMCGGCFWLATCIAAAALSSAGHPQLAIILGLNAAACFGLLALWKRRWGASKYRHSGSWLQRGSCALRDQGLALALQRISTGARIIVGAALSLWLQLFVRLCYAPRFGGDPASFDFGVKCSKEEKGDDGGHWECGQNVSFVFEFNSFGHCLQGCLSVLLFPAVDAVIAHLATSQPSSPASSWAPRLGAGLVLAKDLAAFCVCVYPVYNVIKRAVTHHEDFAASSFCNNAAEWAFGFWIGLEVAALHTVWAVSKKPSEIRQPSAQRGRPPPYTHRAQGRCSRHKWPPHVGLLLMLSAAHLPSRPACG